MVFSVFVFTPFFIPTVSPKPPFRFYDDNPGTIYVIWTIIFSLAVLIIHVSIYRALRQSRGYVFSRIGYFFASGLLIFVAGMSTFPLVFDKPVFPLGVPLIVGSLALMGYAVAQQRVKEPWVIVRNISVGVLVAMPTAGLLALLARAAGGGAGTFTIALFGASLFSPILYRLLGDPIGRWVDQLPLFRRKQLRLSGLQDIIDRLRTTDSVQKLMNHFLEIVRAVGRPRGAEILVSQEHGKEYLVKESFGLDPTETVFLSIGVDSPLVNFMRREHRAIVQDLIPYELPENERGVALKECRFLRANVLIPIFQEDELGLILCIDDRTDGLAHSDLEIAYLSLVAVQVGNRLEILTQGLKNEMKASVWAHDLAKPFGDKGSLGDIESLAKGKFGPIGPDVKRVLERVAQEMEFVGKHLRGFIKGKQERCEARPVKMDEMFQHIKNRFQRIAEEKEIHLKFNLPPLGAPVLCDEQMIEHRVYGNLIENALRHTPKGGTVEVGYRTEGNEFVGWVKDTGPGIKPEDQKRIFEPGVQVGKKIGLGGLGLYSVKTVIESHGGRVWVESEVGKGTSFYFSFPMGSGSGL